MQGILKMSAVISWLWKLRLAPNLPADQGYEESKINNPEKMLGVGCSADVGIYNLSK